MIHQKDLRVGDLVQITVDLPEYKRGDIFVVIDISEVYIGLRSPSESDCRPDMYTIRDHIEGPPLLPTSSTRTILQKKLLENIIQSLLITRRIPLRDICQ